MRPTMKDVARIAQVSTATVSLVVNDKADKISTRTIQRVKEAIEQIGYIPNNNARNLSRSQSSRLGLILPDLHNSFFAELVAHTLKHVQSLGYSLQIATSNDDPDLETKSIQRMIEDGIDGILLTSCSHLHIGSEEHIQNILHSADVPLVLLDRKLKRNDYPCVYSDNFAGAYALCDHLIKRGYKRIACITGHSDQFSSAERLNAYKKALSDADMLIDESLVVEGDYSVDSGAQAIPSLLAHDIDAIFALNDMMALGALKTLNDLGIQVPNQIALAGYDDNYYVSSLHVPITSVKQPVNKIAIAAVNLIIEAIGGSESKQDIVFQPTLHVRKSTLKSSSK